MIRVEVDPQRGEFTLHVDDEGAKNLAQIAQEVGRVKGKGFLGESGAMLIVRHVDFGGAESPAAVQAENQGGGYRDAYQRAGRALEGGEQDG